MCCNRYYRNYGYNNYSVDNWSFGSLGSYSGSCRGRGYNWNNWNSYGCGSYNNCNGCGRPWYY